MTVITDFGKKDKTPFASPFDTAQDAFAPSDVAENNVESQEPFNIQSFWDTLYQTAGPTVEQTGRLAMNPNDPNFGNLTTGRSEQGFEDLVYTPFHEELQAQGIPLYQEDEEGNRLYINLPSGASAIPQSERSQEFHPELFDRFGNYLEGTWEDVSGGEGGIGEYTRKFIETPDYDFFEDVLSDPRIGLFANLVPGGTLALTGAKAAAGMDVSPVEIATSLMQGLNIAGVIEPPSVTDLPSGQVGPPVPNAGRGLFGTTYAQTQTALNVAAAGDVEGAALALVGQPLINRGLDSAGLDQATIEGAGIQYDDFQEGLGQVVSAVAGGAELDEALAQGLGKYIREGGTLGSIDLPETNIDLGVVEDVVRNLVRPLGEAGTALADFVDDAVIRPVGDVLSALDTAVRDALPDIDLPSVDLPRIDLPSVDLPRIDLPSVDLPSVDLTMSEMMATASGAVPMSSTRTTDSLFADELFKFKTKVEDTQELVPFSTLEFGDVQTMPYVYEDIQSPLSEFTYDNGLELNIPQQLTQEELLQELFQKQGVSL